jgi:hypothetical protein
MSTRPCEKAGSDGYQLRGTDGFVGIYPFPGPPEKVPARDELLHESRYFRLELDLAVRSGKPAFVCYDQRYKNILECPASFAVCTFDPQEITGGGAAPSAAAYEKTFAGFCLTIESAMALRNIGGAPPKNSKVGILLPPEKPTDTGYSPEHLATIETLLEGVDYEPVRLRWPPVFDGRFLNTVGSLDWIVVDVGDDPYGAAAVAYLHGLFLPTLRLKRLASATDDASPLERSLYGGVEVGYMNDVVRWRLPDELESGIGARLKIIDLAPRRLSTRAQAEDYFRSAALRKEPVFLSYSGNDAEVGGRISAALRKRFHQVFDYRDGKSIRPGQPWLKETSTSSPSRPSRCRSCRKRISKAGTASMRHGRLWRRTTARNC